MNIMPKRSVPSLEPDRAIPPKEDPRLTDVMHKVEEDLRASVPAEYVQPANRTEQLGRTTVKAVNAFAELPTGELDSLIAGVEAKLAEIKRKAEEIKADYMFRTTELRESVERLNMACLQGEAKMSELHTKLNEIYAKQEKPQ